MEHFEHASNVDLLSTLTGKSAATMLMEEYGGLTKLAQVSLNELQQIKGVGKSRAAAIKSAFLLAQRLSHETIIEPPMLDAPERVADLLRERNRLYTVEVFQTILVNSRRRLIAVQTISQGTLDTILVHPREVFGTAIAHRAAAIILAHNLCVAAHKLCYVQCGFMCSDGAVGMLIRAAAQSRGMAVLPWTHVVLGSMRISPRGGRHA